MNYAIKILKKELREWKQELASSKRFFKGEENRPAAKKSFKEATKNINDLINAIVSLS